jgi:opacity protein-like surface antigen
MFRILASRILLALWLGAGLCAARATAEPGTRGSPRVRGATRAAHERSPRYAHAEREPATVARAVAEDIPLGMDDSGNEWDGPVAAPEGRSVLDEMCDDCEAFEPFGWLRSSANSPRAIGKGLPLVGTSWCNRPYSIGLFAGVMKGDELIDDRVRQDSDALAGFRLGWDFDYYWGLETRLGWAALGVQDDRVPPSPRHDQIFLWDLSLLYYPWGDSRCRPYVGAGLGIASFEFYDDEDVFRTNTLLGLPVGGGVKFQLSPALAVRAEALDNIAFGNSGLDTMHNVSFTLGLELRFGGTRPSYYPWQPARHIW